jgi:6-phosphogluconate dehydrogenase
MIVGVIGLGRMGSAIAYRLSQTEHTILGYDPSPESIRHAKQEGISTVTNLAALAKDADVLWLFVPANVVDSVLAQIDKYLRPGQIIIDGGNSNFQHSITRAEKLKEKQIDFLDCGTSGGVAGKENGFCLMIGGEKMIFDTLTPLFQVVAAPDGFLYTGQTGTGHYVKMIHNGIEYGLMQAYGEGLRLLHEGTFAGQLDLEKITELWNHGAVIRSWLLELTHQIFESQIDFTTISGRASESGMGKWTVEESKKYNITLPVIEAALQARFDSQKTGGDFSTKIVALLRNKFGGHSVDRM